MRTYLHIHLNDRSIETQELNGKDVAFAGRYFIAKSLLDAGAVSYTHLRAHET